VRSAAGRAGRAVDVSDDTARPAQDMVVVVPDASLEPGRTADRFAAAYESRCGKRAEGRTHDVKDDDVKANMAHIRST
jgi:hypothetical protein